MRVPSLRAHARARGGARPLALLVASCALTVGAALHGCQAAPVLVPVRSLERSGRASFVCLDAPGPAGSIEEPLDKCSAQQFTAINEYLYQDDAGDIDAGSGPLPHLYALVTQTTRGEVAVIDTSSTASSVLDENPLEPGANFLPVGPLPTGIASTPGSVATFVGIGGLGHAGIFAIPSSKIRPTASDPANNSFGGGLPYSPPEAGPIPELSSWPACALPSAPGDILLIVDPAKPDGTERVSCDAPDYTTPAEGDLISSREKNGRQKLVVAMPQEGGIIVLDAQTVLNLPPGSFGACPVERWVPLQVDLSGLANVPPQPTLGPACANPAIVTPPLMASYPSTPGGMSYANGELYVADISAPVVHVIDMPTPCAPVERAPLLPTSADEPSRVVFTTRVAAAPYPTPDLRQFVYATDLEDGSVMMFDVGPGSSLRRPIVRPSAPLDPLSSRDRVRFGAPAADIIVVERDIPETNPITGVAAAGVRCDPNPFLITCTPTSTSCDIASAYQTQTFGLCTAGAATCTNTGDTTAYTTGAGPLKLRGEFAYAALTNGKVAVIDVDDFDAPCRGPDHPDPLFGYPGTGASCSLNSECASARCSKGVCEPCVKSSECATAPAPTQDDPFATETSCDTQTGICFANNHTSLEYSNQVVLENAPRGTDYEVEVDTIGDHVPGLVSFPLLYDLEGSLIQLDPTSPMMIPTDPPSVDPCAEVALGVPCRTGTNPQDLFVGGNLALLADLATNHALSMNYEDPRAQTADQNWLVTFEGALPGFDQRIATLRVDPAQGPVGVYDPNSLFCDFGVLSENAVKEILVEAGAKPSRASELADYVQLVTELPNPEDAFWTDAIQGAQDPTRCGGATCTYDTCVGVVGDIDLPLPGRDLRIVEAYEDHVEIEVRNPGLTKTTGPCATAADCSGQAGQVCRSGLCQSLVTLDDVCCCLPDTTQFTIRGGGQWIVTGDQSGFLHHVVADAATGRCRNTCDPIAGRKNGRVVEMPVLPVDGVIPAESRFQNPMFKFAIVSGTTPSGYASRDNHFQFATNGSFVPLLVSLTTDPTVLVLPQAITYVPATGELAVTDGSINGLIFVSLTSATFTRSFF